MQEKVIEEEQNDQVETESVDPELALYNKELMEDWANVNHMAPYDLSHLKNSVFNVSEPKGIWIGTATQNKHKIHWLADNGSPGSFVALEKAKSIINNNPKIRLLPYTSHT